VNQDRQIDVWIVRLQQPDGVVRLGRQVLDDDERARADRFAFEKDVRAFTLSRAALRTILGRRMDLDPAAVAFDYGEKGKPLVRVRGGPHFNLSHSRDIAVIGVVDDCDIGIDVEYARRLRDLDGMARRVFSPVELDRFRGVTGDDQVRYFFDVWTAKEAIVKGFGEGIGYPFRSITVRLDDLASPVPVRHDGRPSSPWCVRRIAVDPPYRCFLAARDEPGRIAVRTFAFPEA
jgi:4'-phosphopantetheinyl transferase